MRLQLYYLTYKDNSSFFGPSGAGRAISCNHINKGLCYINLITEIINVVGPPLGSNEVGAGEITNDAHRFSDANFKQVYCIYDNDSQITSYVDKVNYNTVILGCNPISYPSICGLISGLATSVVGTTTATIIWGSGVNATGYEYVLQATPSTQPVVPGTLVGASPIALTGLTSAHSYRFWIRTVCAANMRSAWTALNFTTG